MPQSRDCSLLRQVRQREVNEIPHFTLKCQKTTTVVVVKRQRRDLRRRLVASSVFVVMEGGGRSQAENGCHGRELGRLMKSRDCSEKIDSDDDVKQELTLR